MDLHNSSARRNALHHVAADAVVFHTGCSGPFQGYEFANGSHLSGAELTALEELQRARLITASPIGSTDPRRFHHPRPVRLTFAGEARMREWSVSSLRRAA